MVSFAQVAQDWQAAGHEGALLASPFFQVAPWIFVALVVALLLQAAATRRRYRAVAVLTPADQERVRAAVREVEDATSADVVPLVVERSDPHAHAFLLAAAALAVAGNVLLLAWLPRTGFLELGLAQLLLLALGLAVARACPDLRRVFLGRARADAAAEEQALVELARLTHDVPSPALVLVFVSLFEHRVVVLARSPVPGALDGAAWSQVVDAVLDHVRRGRLADGLVAGLRAGATQVATAFPPADERPNRFADHALVRRE